MKIILLVVFISLFIWILLIEPKMIKTTEYTLNEESLKGLKIVFVSDLHINKNQEKRLIKLVEKINAQNPDLILFGGDFPAGHNIKTSLSYEKYSEILKKLNSKYGIYSVLGNHDFWVGNDKTKKMLEDAKINVLANDNDFVEFGNKKLYIAGVEDLQTGAPNIEKSLSEVEKYPIVLLTHSPDIFPDLQNTSVKLTLAGHVHGGQIRLPFIGATIIPSKFGNRYSKGLIIENNHKMIVTTGVGTSILPIRFNCSPEIVVINFK